MDRMGAQPIFVVKVSVIIHTMLNFHEPVYGNIICKQTIKHTCVDVTQPLCISCTDWIGCSCRLCCFVYYESLFNVSWFFSQNRSGVRTESRFWGTWSVTESLTAVTSRTKVEPWLVAQVDMGGSRIFSGVAVAILYFSQKLYYIRKDVSQN